MIDAAGIVRDALRGTGVNLAASCGIEAYDRRAPAGFRSGDLMPRARGVVVVGSAGRELWSAFRPAFDGDPAIRSNAHPLDTYVAGALDRADDALARVRIGSRRFEPRLDAPLLVDFRALGELTGLGSPGPFGLLIHPAHGAWWALRGAWLIDVEVAEPNDRPSPCAGCPAPCIEGGAAGDIVGATPAVRGRCVLGQASRYAEEQIAYHYDREPTLAKMRG